MPILCIPILSVCLPGLQRCPPPHQTLSAIIHWGRGIRYIASNSFWLVKTFQLEWALGTAAHIVAMTSNSVDPALSLNTLLFLKPLGNLLCQLTCKKYLKVYYVPSPELVSLRSAFPLRVLCSSSEQTDGIKIRFFIHIQEIISSVCLDLRVNK